MDQYFSLKSVPPPVCNQYTISNSLSKMQYLCNYFPELLRSRALLLTPMIVPSKYLFLFCCVVNWRQDVQKKGRGLDPGDSNSRAALSDYIIREKSAFWHLCDTGCRAFFPSLLIYKPLSSHVKLCGTS